MSVRKLITLSAFVVSVMLQYSCSTTRCLEEDELRLYKNTIIVENDKKFPVSDLTSYLKQKTASWSPMLYVYNWQDGKGKGWDKFCKKAGTPPVVYDSSQTVNSRTNISNHLEYLGYYDSSVSSTENVKTKRKKIAVTYHVHLGKRYPIKDIEYVLPESEEFRNEFRNDSTGRLVHYGDYLSEAVLEKESARNASVLRNAGYYGYDKSNYSFEADTVSVKDSALLRYIVRSNVKLGNNEMSEPKKFTFGKIEVKCPQDLKFRSKLFKDLNILKTGDLYNDAKVNTEYARYNAISLFSSINVQLTPRDSTTIVDCAIYPQKGKTQGFKLGFEASFNTTGLFGISPNLSYYHRNIFHGGEILNVSLRTDHQFKFSDSAMKSNEVAVAASLTIPRFIPFSPKLIKGANIPKTEVKFSYNYQNRPEYERHILSASYGYSGTIRKAKMYYQILPLNFSAVWLPYMSEEFRSSIAHDRYKMYSYSDHNDFGLTGNIYFSNFNYQTGIKEGHGWYAGLQLDMSGNLLALFYPIMKKNVLGQGLLFNSAYSQYVRFDINLGRTWNWTYDDFFHSLALHFEAGLGYAYGNSYSLPFEKQFYSGGANSLRGWTARTVGPGTSQIESYWTIPNQTGDMKLEANAEYRFKIFWKIAGAVFVDAGNIWVIPRGAEGEEDDPGIFRFSNFGECIAADWGAGLRFDLSFLVLRVDMGLRFHDPARTDSKWVGPSEWFQGSNYAFHFGVGFPF